LSNLEIMRNIKRDLIRKRKEIDTMKNVKEKNKVLKAYAELLTSLEIGTLDSHSGSENFAFKLPRERE